jgi:phosphatidylserine/phosphatidylglycerophosphate/cardiolipin synthase-like enzyme
VPPVPRLTLVRTSLALLLIATAVPVGATIPATLTTLATPSASTTPETPSTPLGPIDGNDGGPKPGLPRADETGRILVVYPNPLRDGDAGEYVVVALPSTEAGGAAESGSWSLSDGEATVSIPANASGRVAVAARPDLVDDAIADRTVLAPSDFSLANAGERLVLRRSGAVVDVLVYESAPEGERRLRGTDPRWRPVGFSPRPVVTVGPAAVRAFVLPDSPDLVVETLRTADDRILLAGYTFTSRRAARALVDAASRGATVRVLVDASPVGGITTREAAALDYLSAHGVRVSVLGGPAARYSFHHAKYAVVDDRAVVLTENWKPSGIGGRSSRGWGVVVDSPAVAAELAEIFRTDAGGRDVTPWRRFRRGRTFERSHPANRSFPSRFGPETVSAERISILTAPGNAEEAVVDIIDGAGESVSVIQPTVEYRSSFLRACVRAAERGVRVRILLSQAWYVAPKNRALAERLNDRAERRGLPLEVRVAEPNGRYEKIHAKGLIVDSRVVVLGSLNWNSHSARENREVALALYGEEVAAYYGRVFEADWRGGTPRLPLSLVGALVLALAVAAVVARRQIEFEV